MAAASSSRVGELKLCASLLAGVVGVLSTTPPAHAGQTLVLRDFILTHGIDEREPIDITDSYLSSDKRAYAFFRIHNLGTPTNVSETTIPVASNTKPSTTHATRPTASNTNETIRQAK